MAAFCSDLFAQDFPSWTASLNISVPDRHEPGRSQPRTYPPAIHPDADAAQEPAAAGGDAGALQARNVQTNQQRVQSTRGVAGARRTASRGRAAEVPGRHVHELPGLPGAARPLAGAQQRAERDSRLRPVGGRSRNRAGSAARRRRAWPRSRRSRSFGRSEGTGPTHVEAGLQTRRALP